MFEKTNLDEKIHENKKSTFDPIQRTAPPRPFRE